MLAAAGGGVVVVGGFVVFSLLPSQTTLVFHSAPTSMLRQAWVLNFFRV